MIKKMFLCVFILLLTSSYMHAQRKITGTVSDDSGPLPGATIVIKNTFKGVTSDFDGSYSIEVNSGDILVFSHIGMVAQEIPVNAQTAINVTLLSDSAQLDEVVVVAYGSSRKEDLTGSVALINSEDIKGRTITSASSALEGAAPGVTAVAGGGQPGSGQAIRIRGFGSFNSSNAPLYVVDGVPLFNSLNSISTEDIESFTILKDASATALYGNRASNGVVIITTKKGKTEKGSFNVDISLGVINDAIPKYNKVDAFEYYPLMWEAYRNSRAIPGVDTAEDVDAASLRASDRIHGLLGYNPFNVPNDQIVGIDGKINPNASLLYPEDLDWYNAINRTGIRTNYNISYQGKSDKVDYYASLGFLDEEGYIKSSDFSRVNSRLNVNYQAKKWLKTGINMSLGLTKGNFLLLSGTGNIVSFTRRMAPIYPIYEHDPDTGSYILDENGNRVYDRGEDRPSAANPGRHVIQENELNKRENSLTNLSGNTYFDIQLAKGLSFRTNLSYQERFFYFTRYRNPIIGDAEGSGNLYKEYSKDANILFNQLLNYNQSFGYHNIEVLAGHESSDYEYTELNGSRDQQIVDGLTEFRNFVDITDLESYVDSRNSESYFGRLNYNYNSKYYLSGSIRWDGTSRLAPDKRWDSFWSIGASWRINNETFMLDANWIDNLKLRASYGEVGNVRGIGNYPWQTLYSLDFNNQSDPGYVQAGLGAPDLLWESNKQLDVALEFGLFNRLSGSVEFYRKETYDAIFGVPVPLSSGYTTVRQNLAEMYNQGIEIGLSYDILKGEDYSWNFNVNAATLKNEITKLPQGIVEDDDKRFEVGVSRYEYWVRDWWGVDPTDGAGLFVADDPDASEVRIIDGVALTPRNNNAKKHYAGSVIPDLSGSFTNKITYKNFGLDFMFTYQIGGKNLDYVYASLMNSGTYGRAAHSDLLNRWQEPGDITDVPRMDVNYEDDWSRTWSDRWLIDASYLNLRYVNLSYSLPKQAIKKIGVSESRIYLNAENLFLLNKRKGYVQHDFDGGTDNVYRPSKAITFGVNFKF